MASAKIVVRYEDGTEKSFNPNKPRLLLDLEKKYGVQAPEKHEHLFWLAHRAVGGDTPFDEWVDSVEEVDAIGADQPEDGGAVGEGDRS